MKVLITGATGRIGRYVLFYKPPDMDVEILLSPVSQLLPEYPWYRSNIADYEKTRMAITCADPDIVIHLAGITNVDDCELDPDLAFRINTDGTGNVAKSCVESGAKLVLLSTDYVFDGIYGPYSESDSPNPINVYGRSKLESEHAASVHVKNLLIVRVSVPFGKKSEGTEHNFVSWLIEQLQAQNTVNAAEDQFTTPAYFDEFSHVLWTLIRKDISGIIHYGTSDRLSRYEMGQHVCQIMDFPDEFIRPVKISELNLIAKRPLESGFITEKVHEILNMPPLSFNDALLRMTEPQETVL